VTQDFIVSFHLRTDENGADVIGAPFVPLRIQADSPTKALEVFVNRSDGQILDGLRKVDERMHEAAVNVDRKIYRVLVSNAT
jgi:hypothetical protein